MNPLFGQKEREQRGLLSWELLIKRELIQGALELTHNNYLQPFNLNVN